MVPQRIASLLASGTEMLCAIGLGDRLVAVSHECDFPPAVATLPRATRTHVAAERASVNIDVQVKQLVAAGRPLYEIDVELLARLRPELIVTQAQCDVCAVRYQDVLDAVANEPALRQSQVVALNPQALDDVLDDILRVGRAADSEAAAESYVAALRLRIDQVAARTATLAPGERPRVACLEWLDPLMIAGNWMPDMLTLAGGDCPLTQSGSHSPYIAWSEVVRFDPELIVVMPCGFDLQRTVSEAALLPHLPGWSKLTAVQSDRVYAVDGNAYFNRSGPRLVDSLELLAHLVHPKLIAEPASMGWAVKRLSHRPSAAASIVV